MDLLNIPYSTSLDYTSNQLLASSDSYTCNFLSLSPPQGLLQSRHLGKNVRGLGRGKNDSARDTGASAEERV